MPTTPEECLDALHEAAERLGSSPTKAQYERLGLTPASGTIRRTMDSWNAAKEAAGLKTYDPGDFGGPNVHPKPDGIEIPDGVAWPDLSSQQRWYYKNRESRIERKDRRRADLRRWLYERKREELHCARCGEGHPASLDFHHTEEKDLGVAEMVVHGYSKESIEAEIDACIVLCANCHRKEHYEPPPTESDSV